MTYIGDIVICNGKIVEKFKKDGEKFIRVELQAKTQKSKTIVSEVLVVLE